MFSVKMLNNVSLAAMILAAAFTAAVAPAAVYNVYPNGSGQYPTIQSAIDAAANGDTVVLHPGTFTGAGNYDIDYGGLAITVESLNGDPSEVIIDCQGLGRGFYFHNDEESDSVLRGVTVTNGFISNNDGGGVRCGQPGFPPFIPAHHGSPLIEDCVFIDNSARSGGGVACTDESHPILNNCVLEDNSLAGLLGTHYGGGMYCMESSPTLYECRFINNTSLVGPSGGAGGGMYCEASTPDLDYCVFSGNTGTTGGGLCSNVSSPTLDFCTFSGNSGGASGGGMYCYGNTLFPIPLTNCTFYGNSAWSGGGITSTNQASLSITRSIIAYSTEGEAVYCTLSGTATITCCDIYGNAGGAGCVAGQIGSNNNFAAEPAFCGMANEDFTLRDVSPCAPANSPCGQQLIGAWGVGCTGPLTFLVCPDGTGDFLTIQPAITAAFNGDIVELCDATFTGPGNRDLDYGGKAITVRSQSGNPQACIIACGGNQTNPHRGFDFHSGETSQAVLEGVTITGGYMTIWPGGGAIICTNGSSPTITNCILTENHTTHEGGGLYCSGSSPSISFCTFNQNTSVGIGGGMIFGWDSPGNINNCTFSYNAAQDDGGGLATFSHVELEDCTFVYNDALGHGGGMTCMGDAGGSMLWRCFFSHNTASNPNWDAGGGLSAFVMGLQFEWCTFASNSATTDGGGVYGAEEGFASFLNCTFYGNAAPNGGGIFGGGILDNTIIAFGTLGQAIVGTTTLTCCDVFGNAGGPGSAGPWIGAPGSGNIALDPLFCNPASETFTLRPNSPCAPFSPPNPQCDLIGAWPVMSVPPGPILHLSARNLDGPNKVWLADDTGTIFCHYDQQFGAENDGWGYRDGASDGTHVYFGWSGGVVRHDCNPPGGGAVLMFGPGPLSTWRALAYDPTGDGGNGSLWSADFASNLVEVTLAGAVLTTFPNAGWSLYGLAYDNDDGNLWGHDNLGLVIKINTATGAIITGAGWPTGFVTLAAQGGLSSMDDGTGNLAAISQGTPDELGVYDLTGALVLGPVDVEAQSGSNGHLGVAVCPEIEDIRGDMNCDGIINAFDIDPFVLALTNPAGYAAAWPNCNIMNGDINCDGVLNAFDIDPFVQCLVVGTCPPCP